MPTDYADIRDELGALGRRRAQHDAEDEQLSREIREALEKADGQVSMTEAATLLGIHRTTLYRVYK